MDYSEFFNVAVAGIPLLFVVLGLVEWVKQFGVHGNWLRLTSMIVGLVLGMGYQLSVAIPSTFAGWFAVVFYGLALGLVSSGVYDAAKRVFGRAEVTLNVAGIEQHTEE